MPDQYDVQKCQGHERQEKPEKLSQNGGDWRRHDDEMQCGILDGILEQKKDIGGKTGEIKM